MTDQNNLLFEAVKEDDVAKAMTLLGSGTNVNVTVWDRPSGLIHFAKSADMFNLLVGEGIKVDHETLVHAGGNFQTIQLVQWLIDFGLPVDGVEDASGDLYTSLMNASGFGNFKVVKLLLENCANPNVFGRRTRWSALHFAVNNVKATPKSNGFYQHREIIDLLIQSGALVDARNDEGMTPLMQAADRAAPDVVKRLLTIGANIHAIDLRNRTAEDHALQIQRTGRLDVGRVEQTLEILRDWSIHHPLSIDAETGEVIR